MKPDSSMKFQTVIEQDAKIEQPKEPLEVETIVGVIDHHRLFDHISRYHDIGWSPTLYGRIKELTRKFKAYCKSEPADSTVSLQLWLWEHITGTYRKLRKHLSSFSKDDKEKALIFLTVLYIGVFDKIPPENIIRNVTKGYYTPYEQVIIDHALQDLCECLTEISIFQNSR